MNIRIETRFSLGEQVFATHEEETHLCIIDKMQYVVARLKSGAIKESISYRCSIIGSGRTFWVDGNQLIHKQ